MKIKVLATGASKIEFIKLLKELTNLQLYECKQISDTILSTFEVNRPESEFPKIDEMFSSLGATVVLENQQTAFLREELQMQIDTKTLVPVNIRIDSVGTNKIEFIKLLRNLTDLPLNVCNNLYETPGSTFFIINPEHDFNKIRDMFFNIGASVSLDNQIQNETVKSNQDTPIKTKQKSDNQLIRYKIKLNQIGSDKHHIISTITKYSGLSLSESKMIAEIIPSVFYVDIPEIQMYAMVIEFKAAGCVIDIVDTTETPIRSSMTVIEKKVKPPKKEQPKSTQINNKLLTTKANIPVSKISLKDDKKNAQHSDKIKNTNYFGLSPEEYKKAIYLLYCQQNYKKATWASIITGTICCYFYMLIFGSGDSATYFFCIVNSFFIGIFVKSMGKGYDYRFKQLSAGMSLLWSVLFVIAGTIRMNFLIYSYFNSDFILKNLSNYFTDLFFILIACSAAIMAYVLSVNKTTKAALDQVLKNPPKVVIEQRSQKNKHGLYEKTDETTERAKHKIFEKRSRRNEYSIRRVKK